MTWISVKRRGLVKGKYYNIKSISKQKGYKFVNRFLEKITRNFIKENFKFTKVSYELSYEHGELQLHSTLFPSIFKEVDVCFREIRTKRFGGHRGDMGRIDYYTEVEGQQILIEVKHHKINPNAKSFRILNNKWSELIEQIIKLDSDSIRLGLMVVPFRLRYILGKYEEFRWWKNEEIKNFGFHAFQKVDPLPDWCTIIQIRDSDLFPERKNEDFYYPAILLMAFKM